jgi:stage II sporulation protein D
LTPIRVRIMEAELPIFIAGTDLVVQQAKRSKEELFTHADALQFQCKGDKISVKGKKSAFFLTSPLVVKSSTGFLELRAPAMQARTYRNDLRIISTHKGCKVVNHLPLENYLVGLVNSEFSANWSSEAVAAQVVAARTYAFYQMQMAKKKKNLDEDLDSTVKDQVYDGSQKENIKAFQAIEKTKGLILISKKSKEPLPIKAFYHSTCGGRTELPETVWGVHYSGMNESVGCPYCSDSPVYHWQLDLTLSEVEEMIKKLTKNKKSTAKISFSQNRLVSIRRGPLTLSNRVAHLETRWEGTGPEKAIQTILIPAPQFRNAIGPQRFKSTAFEIVPVLGVSGQLRFQGRGNGHGVGLCQWGAKGMGERGFTTAQILHHYYPDATIQKLW